MKYISYNFYFYMIFLVALMSCNNNDINEDTELINKIQIVTSNMWKELEIEARDSIIIEDKVLHYNVLYKNNYFLLKETKLLIYSYLFYELDSLSNDFDKVVISDSYVDLTDGDRFEFTIESIIDKQEKMKNNPLFRDIIIYTLNNLNTNEVIGFTEMVSEVREVLPDEFEHEGSFWLLLHSFSENCCDTNSVAYKSMRLMSLSANYPERPYRPEVIDHIIEMGYEHCSSTP